MSFRLNCFSFESMMAWKDHTLQILKIVWKHIKIYLSDERGVGEGRSDVIDPVELLVLNDLR